MFLPEESPASRRYSLEEDDGEAAARDRVREIAPASSLAVPAGPAGLLSPMMELAVSSSSSCEKASSPGPLLAEMGLLMWNCPKRPLPHWLKEAQQPSSRNVLARPA
uniref:Uncharacterized protein n=1 Tax=Sphaerodactylus townsendi TaxID=933632 RepID=A0ACB8FJK4_9SAUR